MEETLTVKEAYRAMLIFWDHLYNLTKSDDVGGFLGGMEFLPDGSTRDPAAWHDWLAAVDVVKVTRNLNKQ